MEPKEIKYFKTSSELRKWYKANHKNNSELWVGFYKKDSGKQSVTYPEALDETLCFGWIDGIRKRVDDEIYLIRFTPRKPKSYWSVVNIKKANALIKSGKMQEAGLKEFEKRDKKKSGSYSFERAKVKFSPAFEKKFKSNKLAWKNFQAMPPSYQKPATWWVMSAKQEETRLKRLQLLISDSENGLRIKQMRRSSN
jgi:uncharacterized protein YdeI (YjbR/CyaY-like superfamily)